MNREIWITFADIRNLLLQKRKFLFRICAAAFSISLLFHIQKPIVYTAYASFKQNDSQKESVLNLDNLMRSVLSSGANHSARSILHSRKVLRKVSEHLGLQAVLNQKRWFLSKLQTIKNNIQTEFGGEPEAIALISCCNIRYERDKPLHLELRCLDNNCIELFNPRTQDIATGSIGTSMVLGDLTITISNLANVEYGRVHYITILPWHTLESKIRSCFVISPYKDDASILELKMTHSDPAIAAQFLNLVMEEYRLFMKEETNQIAQAQLGYLDQRQQELELRLEQALQDNAAYLQENIGKEGFVGLQERIEALSSSLTLHYKKLLNLQIELAHFKKADAAHTESNQHSAWISQSQDTYLTAQIENTQAILSAVEKKQPIPYRSGIFANLITQMEAARQLQEISPPEQQEMYAADVEKYRCQLEEALRDFLHALQNRRQLPPTSDAYTQTLASDFRGLDLKTAKNIQQQYQKSLDELHTSISNLQHMQRQFTDPSIEIASISDYPHEPIIRNMIQKASEMELQLQDTTYRSSKEHERLKEALSLQKRYLSLHLAQIIDLNKIRVELTREKLAMLQDSVAHLIQTEIDIVQENLTALKQRMDDLPQQWRIENRLKLKTEIIKTIIEGLHQITEAKIVNNSLFYVNSQAIDNALVPKNPNSIHLLPFSVFIGLLASFASSLFFLMRGVFQGITPAPETMFLLGNHVSGTASRTITDNTEDLAESDLETLRKAAHFLLQRSHPTNQIVSVLERPCPFWSHIFADLLHQYHKKIIIVDCSFDRTAQTQDQPGLWHYLTAAIIDIPIRNMKHYDLITAGAATRAAVELFSSTLFTQMIQKLTAQYDIVLLKSTASLQSTEATLIQSLAQCSVTLYQDAKLDTLTTWARQKENHPVTFVFCN